jgi:hypothetical protein
MKIGMTGTRHGLTEEAIKSFNQIIKSNEHVTEFHHGDCVGADGVCHDIAVSYNIHTIIHPPNINSLRANKNGSETRTPQNYLTRNHNIVNETEMLVAFPQTDKEITRSGTWSTVRYARKNNKKIILVFPDGSTKIEMPIVDNNL